LQVGVSETISHLAQANIKLAVDLQAATAEKEALKNKADTMARQLAAAQVVWDVRVPSKLKLNLCFQADHLHAVFVNDCPPFFSPLFVAPSAVQTGI